MSLIKYLFTITCTAHCFLHSAQAQTAHSAFNNEPHRPQIHFSPKAHWMNDPNGMVYHDGIYHLFFQYYPDATVWGPMHWGHATSTDLVNWTDISEKIQMPEGIRHGTVFTITTEELAVLLK